MEAESYNQTRMASKSARKRSKKISDTDSDDAYSASQTSQSTSLSSKQHYVPRFLVIHSEEEGKDISSLSPFLIHKTIMSVAGEPKSIKNLRSGDLLIQCAKEPHEKNLLKMKKFCDVKCTVTPYSSLNVSKGIVRCPALNKQTDEHILEFMKEQGVTAVRRINVFRDNVLKPSNTFVFTFSTPVLPSTVKIGFIQAKVDVYIPNPLRCYQCQIFGHHEHKCGRQAVCANCGMPEHCPSGQCQRPARCANCSGDHPANSKQCPTWEKEKKILKIKCEQNITFPEARKQFEQFNAVQTYASAVKPSTCNKQTQTVDKDTQTDDSFTEYLKQQTASEKTGKEKTNEKQGKGTSSPSPGPALKPATLEMMKKEEEKKKKEEKDRLKKQQKEERRQQFIKDKQEKELKEKEQAEKSQQNPFSVLHKDDEVVCMEEESVVFTDSSSFDHLPKGTLPRLPVT